MKDKEIKEFIEKGHILCKVIFEMAGNPKEHVESTLRKYVSAIKEDPNYIFMNEVYEPAEENDGIWSTILETDILVSNFEKLNILCFNLTPSSIDIIEPESFAITQKEMTYWYNDLLSKLHEISISLKNLSSENDLLKVNLNRAIRNSIILSLIDPKTIDEIVIKTGIDKEHLQPFLDALIKEKSIILEGNKYAKK
jgi:hypothetical protein